MSDREIIKFDILLERMAEHEQWTKAASSESAIEQCIYLEMW